MKYIEAVIGIIIKKRKVYVAKRKYKKNEWEFPGGKIKKNEKLVNALKRELTEEVGIQVLTLYFYRYVQYIDYKKKLKLYFFLIKKWRGEPYSREGCFYTWKFFYDLKSSDFPPANHSIISSLKNNINIPDKIL